MYTQTGRFVAFEGANTLIYKQSSDFSAETSCPTPRQEGPNYMRHQQ